jgi:hypothetical protein
MVQASAPSMTRLTRAQREQWARENLPSRVQVALDTPFGKESLSHSFSSAIAFRHVLILVFKSEYLSVRAKRTLLRTSPFALKLNWLCRQYGRLDFTPLPRGIPANLSTPNLIPHLKGLVTACFLHFNFNTPTVVRYIGGQHTAAYRDVPAILAELWRANVDPGVLANLKRNFTLGSPSFCNANATERNFRAFLAYGNHKTITEDLPKTQKALAKDIRRGYVLIMDPWLTFFVPNLHQTPLGMVDLNSCTKTHVQSLIVASGQPHGPWRSTISPVRRQSPKLSFLKHGCCTWHGFGTYALPTLDWKSTLAMTMSAGPFVRSNIIRTWW